MFCYLNLNTKQGLKMLTPKQMLQRLAIALAQGKTCISSKSLQNLTREITYLFVSSKINY